VWAKLFWLRFGERRLALVNEEINFAFYKMLRISQLGEELLPSHKGLPLKNFASF
jgi:hypothetical protein